MMRNKVSSTLYLHVAVMHNFSTKVVLVLFDMDPELFAKARIELGYLAPCRRLFDLDEHFDTTTPYLNDEFESRDAHESLIRSLRLKIVNLTVQIFTLSKQWKK